MATELLTVLLRIVTIFPLVLTLALVMGKRAIGEMPVFDFLVVVILASVVGADIADPNIHHGPTILAIIAICLLQRLVSTLAIRYRPFGKRITFEPTVVIEDGKILTRNLKALRYSVDNVLQMLRGEGVFHLSDVQLAIIEASGELSVLKKPAKDTPTSEQLSIQVPEKAPLSYPLIIDGKVQKEMLQKFGLTESKPPVVTGGLLCG
ncbi:DUF421 domain-containing protein [Shouchella shacheensis]|uniref:DUF421 domain-containing protein n=1 Tax=Shouchella shacheensis TaxID=1649580 RepID=UPI000740127F|nr:DUF421 domain-containing protein [Shouchella shacheensis]